MNKYVQQFIELRNAQKKAELKEQMFKVMNNLKIGEKEYPENSDFNLADYPFWDENNGKYYRYNAGDISEEEFNMLVQDSPKSVEKKGLSGWATFATVIMILSAIGLLILTIISIGEENAMYFLIGLGEFIMISLFCGIVHLIADIKFSIDNNFSI